MGRKYYVVWNGLATGVFDSWDECKLQVTGVPGARYKSFPTRDAAVAAFRGRPEEHLGLLRAIASHRTQHVNYEAFPDIRLDALAVDAACSRNPGPVEYRGVWVSSGIELFRVGPLAGGTNNIGEFLALVHALALFQSKGYTQIPIYTDSRTARSWLRNRQVKTNLLPTADNARIRTLLARAISWVNNNSPANPVLVWDTRAWGEIPADFGRK